MSNFDLKEYFESVDRGDYQRENFDDFLKKMSFSYKIPSIHIAGSNGKGTTANYLANIYRAHGLTVGLFTSPYVDNVNEMISINGQNITDEEIISFIKENEKLFNKYSLSAFEIQTFIALSYFNKKGVDLAIIECGMGGEIDATNIFNPILSVITSISLEHTSFLGRSLCEIAYQKAGVIKDEIPVVTGILDDEAINTIVEVAKERNSQVVVAVEPAKVVYDNYGYTFAYSIYTDLRINSSASYSLKDACIALEAIIKLLGTYPVSEEEIREGLAKTYMPVRMEILSEKPFIIVDGSHNPEGVQNMVKSLQNVAQGREIHVLFACFRDKNIERMLAYLGEYSKDIVLTTFPHKRARTMEDYFLYLEDHSYNENPEEALNELVNKYPDDVILIVGSLAFVAYMKRIIKRG
ncbi:MAG: hypothetical protein J6T25_03355 [Bacilli bacterium]|nr:hypothetical protein [Bacilli bacterium]